MRIKFLSVKVRCRPGGESQTERKSERGLTKERGGLTAAGRGVGSVKEGGGVQFHSSRCQL